MGYLDDLARRRIDGWRKSAHMTQAALAEKAGRNAVWISRWLDNAYDADLDTLERLAGALGHSLTELLGDVPPGDEGELLERFRALGAHSRETVLRMLRDWTPDVTVPSPAPPPATSPASKKATRNNHGKRGTRKE